MCGAECSDLARVDSGGGVRRSACEVRIPGSRGRGGARV